MPDDVANTVNPASAAETATTALIDALRAGRAYGHSGRGADRSVLVEFVSAHPNVPLSLAHARGGVVGDMLAALHSASGFTVEREFYVNDVEGSRPLRIFASAVYDRYRRRLGLSRHLHPLDDPEYGGAAFLDALADRVYTAEGERFAGSTGDDVPAGFGAAALRASQAQHAERLESFGIRFDNWARESELNVTGAVAETVSALRAAGHAEQRGGALWLLSARFGDEADRMLLRADGTATYLAGDLAYHRAKFARSFDRLIDVWNADHATYVARTRAGLEALGFDPRRLDVVLVQSARVLKDGTAVKGGVTGTEGVGLADLIDELGADAARFCLALSPVGVALDLDVDSARLPTSPFGRVRTALRRVAAFADIDLDSSAAEIDTALLTEPAERTVLASVRALPGVVERAARELSVHLIPQYALGLADALLALPSSPTTSTPHGKTRVALYAAAALALENALILIGISPAEISTSSTVSTG